MKLCHLEQMDGLRDYYTMGNKSDEDKLSYDITYTWNLVKKCYQEFRKQKQMDFKTKLMVTIGKPWGGELGGQK